MSMADVDDRGVGKKNATRSTAARMRKVLPSMRKPKRKHGITELVTYTLSAALASTSVLSILAAHSIITYVAMSLAIFNSANTLRQRVSIAVGKTLRDVINMIRHDINILTNLNSSLTKEVDEVKEEASRLKGIQKRVQDKMDETHQDVNVFMDSLRENHEIQKRMKQIIKQQVMQAIIEQVVKSDKDGDFQISHSEVDMLLTRLDTLEGFSVEEDRFRRHLALRGYGLESVITVIKNLMDHEEEEDSIFHFDVGQYQRSLGRSMGIREFKQMDCSSHKREKKTTTSRTASRDLASGAPSEAKKSVPVSKAMTTSTSTVPKEKKKSVGKKISKMVSKVTSKVARASEVTSAVASKATTVTSTVTSTASTVTSAVTSTVTSAVASTASTATSVATPTVSTVTSTATPTAEALNKDSAEKK